MSSVVIEILFAGLAALVGLTAGWWLRGACLPRTRAASAPDPLACSLPAAPSPPATTDNGRPTAAGERASDGAGQVVARSGPPVQDEPPPGSFCPVTAEARAAEILARLQEVAIGVAAHVDDHSACVRQISDELEADESGESTAVFAAMAKLVEANKRMQAQLAAAERKLEEQSREIETASAEAHTDALTKVANRRAFDRAMQRGLADLHERGRPLSLMLLDVDHFKKFNDKHGHQAGDEVLRGVGEVLKRRFQGAEVVSRYGGEEFAVIFPGDTLGGARTPGERARQAIGEARFSVDGIDLRVTASAGMAEAAPGDDAEAVIKRADEALYVSKKSGRNCGHWHDGKTSHRLSLDALAAAAPEKRGEDRPQHADPLTGLSNSVAFVEDVTRRLAEMRRYDTPLSVVLLQIDDHDLRLDKQGVKTASMVVKTVAQFLRAAMRDMDHVSRYNDDTFALLLPTASLSDAVKVGERLRQAISRCSIAAEPEPIQFTVCVGVAQAERMDETLKLLRRAQAAVGMAKSRGKNLTGLHDGRECRMAPPPPPSEAKSPTSRSAAK